MLTAYSVNYTKMKELTDEQFEDLRQDVIGLPEKKDYWNGWLVTDIKGEQKLRHLGIFEYNHGERGCGYKLFKRLRKAFGKYVERKTKYETVQHTGEIKLEGSVFNEFLISVNDVMVERDCCTERLQDHLNDGWKIIAVCNTGTRRPDYVFGKNKGE